MNLLTLVLLAITINFAVILAVKQISGLRFCAICAAVSISWLAMLLLRVFSVEIEPAILALFIGQSVIGVYYMIESRLPDVRLVFRLPILLTLSLGAYGLVLPSFDLWQPLLFVCVVWIFFSLVYAYRSVPRFAQLSHQLIECCKNW